MKNILFKVFLGFLSIFVLVITLTLFSDVSISLLSSAPIMASMLAIGNIEDVSDAETSGENIAGKLYIIAVDQVDDNVPFPKPNIATREVGQIPMKDGEYMKHFVAHNNPLLTFNGEKGDITTTGDNTLSFVLGGTRDQILSFIEQYPGGKFILIFKGIHGQGQDVLQGRVQDPQLILGGLTELSQDEGHNDKDGRYVTVTFKRNSVKQYNKYTGNIVTAPAAKHTAGDTTLSILRGQGVYSIPDGGSETYAIASVSGITDSDKGRTITLVGAGEEKSATIADNSAFVLEDGATWTAKAGSRISFRILDSTTLVEIQGSRIQTA